jgi:hypothetical protein
MHLHGGYDENIEWATAIAIYARIYSENTTPLLIHIIWQSTPCLSAARKNAGGVVTGLGQRNALA